MARTQDETPFYIRTRDGETFYVETLEEALQEFASTNGYRLSLIADQNEIVIRRSELPHDDGGIHELLGEQSFVANVIVKNHNQK